MWCVGAEEASGRRTHFGSYCVYAQLPPCLGSSGTQPCRSRDLPKATGRLLLPAHSTLRPLTNANSHQPFLRNHPSLRMPLLPPDPASFARRQSGLWQPRPRGLEFLMPQQIFPSRALGAQLKASHMYEPSAPSLIAPLCHFLLHLFVMRLLTTDIFLSHPMRTVCFRFYSLKDVIWCADGVLV